MICRASASTSSTEAAADDAGVSGWGIFVILIYGGCLACTSAPALRQRCEINNSDRNCQSAYSVGGRRRYEVLRSTSRTVYLENQHIMCWYLAQAQKNAFVSLALVRVKTSLRCVCRYSPRRCALLHERRGRLVVNSSNVRSERMFYFHFLPPPRGRDSILRNSYAVLPDYRHLVTLTGGRISKI